MIRTLIVAAAAAFISVAALAAPADSGRGEIIFVQAPVPKSIPTQTSSTQITTTAPVSSDTTISVGTLAGQILTWLAAAFSVPIGGLLSAWLYRLFTLAGVQATTVMKDQLQAIIVNGLNAAAVNSAERLKGQGSVAIKSAIIADTVKYTQEHASETIKALGLDPQSGRAVEAIKARIETAINDPSSPTPSAVTPDSTMKRNVI